MDAKTKELAKQVDENKEGITPEQLKALLEAEAPTNVPTQQAAVEPAPAPTPSAPAGTPTNVDPTLGQPNVLDLIPEKFRASDVPTSLSNIAKSYSDLESELKKQKDETAQLNKLVQSFIEREPVQQSQQVQPKPVEVDDSEFFERPTESAKKIAAQMAAAQIIAYHAAVERQKYVESFKASHPDFENYREDIMAILKTRPDLDRDERNLPMVYEMGKQRYNARMSTIRKDLGLESQQSQPSSVDIETVKKLAYEQALAKITEDLNKRKAALGIQGASPAVAPNARIQPRVTEQQLSPDDQLIQDMLNSGPKKLMLGE